MKSKKPIIKSTTDVKIEKDLKTFERKLIKKNYCDITIKRYKSYAKNFLNYTYKTLRKELLSVTTLNVIKYINKYILSSTFHEDTKSKMTSAIKLLTNNSK